MGRSRYQIIEQCPYFLTCTTVNWTPIFSKPELAQIIFNSLSFLQEHQRLSVHGYVLMENHLHLIASSANLSKEIGKFKSFTARSIIDHLKQTNNQHYLTQLRLFKLVHKIDQDYQLWQEGSHPQAILSEEVLQQKLEYIHNNPVKRGYVDDPAHWRYSSYRNYLNQEGILSIDYLSPSP
jgi:REP element-mobilizing transposase RayT